MPVPRFISASCGISIRIRPEKRAEAEATFRNGSRLGADEYAYYHIVQPKGGEVSCEKITV